MMSGTYGEFPCTGMQKADDEGACPTKQCLFPKPCKNLEVDHKDYIALLKKLRVLPGVKKYLSVRVSGLII